MNITKQNIHKHELIGLNTRIIESPDKHLCGLHGKIVDETKNTFKIEILGEEKIIPKKGTTLAMKIGKTEIAIDASKLLYRPEDRIKKAKKKAVI